MVSEIIAVQFNIGILLIYAMWSTARTIFTYHSVKMYRGNAHKILEGMSKWHSVYGLPGYMNNEYIEKVHLINCINEKKMGWVRVFFLFASLLSSLLVLLHYLFGWKSCGWPTMNIAHFWTKIFCLHHSIKTHFYRIQKLSSTNTYVRIVRITYKYFTRTISLTYFSFVRFIRNPFSFALMVFTVIR